MLVKHEGPQIPYEYVQDSEFIRYKSSGVSNKGDVHNVQRWGSTGEVKKPCKRKTSKFFSVM